MSSRIYHKLREQLDHYLVGFPSTVSGVEIKILEKLFTEEDARMYLNLNIKLENPHTIAERTKQDVEIVTNHLERMAEKGLIFRLKKDGAAQYAAAAFLFGIFEYQVKNMRRELAELIEKYFEEAFLLQMSQQIAMVRTIPVNRAIDVSWTVVPYDNAREIIKSQNRIALSKCICRVKQGLIDRACDNPMEVCFYFGSNGNYFVEKQMGRWISQEEALEIQGRCEEQGLVTQPDNSQNPIVMCHCCKDCCVMLRSIKKQPKPAEMIISNYFAAVDTTLCDGCGTCLNRCQMEAITIGPENVAVINPGRCIGCGLCVNTCPTSARSLRQKPEKQRHNNPLKPSDRMIQIAKERGKTLVPLAFTKTS